MLPIGDEREPGGPPALVTLALVAINVVVFLFELSRPSEGALQSLIQAWGVVPHEYAAGHDLAPLVPVPFWATLVTSMFLHGGWLHLGGNMLYLWIFGDNVERAMGHARFLLFYLVCGIVAALAHILGAPHSDLPTVGASGAISGVLGGYLVLFPRNRVRVLTRMGVTAVPAFITLGLWILLQVFSQIGAVTRTSETGGGGVAYLAHIGGFIAGLVLVRVFTMGRGSSLPGPPASLHF